ncbi:MAG TPA: hypothetical protein VFZ09_33140 [Archangium sp.]|uniref:hypothetical protein n=1 Tax=Archangium sp. TaxID=1872627 RepID=UPI002E363AEB|nr:hypothetical protein [Archangium sp.]HEX5751118.1 hypothetical protein [Archangium sp.]
MPLSAEQLLGIARSYWRSDKDYYLRQEKSPETERLQALWERELEKVERWKAFLKDLQQELPGFSIGNVVTTADASFRCIAYPVKGTPPPSFDQAVVGCVSILAPVYIIYGVEYERTGASRSNPRIVFEPLPPGMRFPADVIARRIEAVFGVSALPRDIAEVPVPLFVEWKEPPNTTLFHALFTSEPGNLP